MTSETTAETQEETTVETSGRTAPPVDIPESAKRRQIIEGARQVFLSEGFDAASMGEIAREARVSKGTLYVYFDSKEALFAALIAESKGDTAESNLALDPDDPDIRGTLTAFATTLIGKVTAADHVALVRMVVAASEKFPSLARVFFEAGPARGAAALTAYIEAQNRRGRLAVPDPEASAWQFLGACTQCIMIALLAAAVPSPTPERAAYLAGNAVDMFLAAYGTDA